MIWMIEDDWSKDQRLTVWDMMEKGGSQEECAKRMKTHQSTIARRLSAGRYYLYRETLDITEKSIQLLEEKS
jgi:transcriptional regulator